MSTHSATLVEIVEILQDDEGVVSKLSQFSDSLEVPLNVKFPLSTSLNTGAKSTYDYVSAIIGNWTSRNGRMATVANLQIILKKIGCQSAADKLEMFVFRRCAHEIVITGNSSSANAEAVQPMNQRPQNPVLERQIFTAVDVGKLPTGLSRSVPYYDGSDNFIYLFGGACDGKAKSHIIRFNITSSGISNFGNLPGAICGSPLHADNSGNIFLFGGSHGDNSFKSIFIYHIQNRTTSTIGDLPYKVNYSTSVNRTDDDVLIFCGLGKRNGVLSYSLSTGIATPCCNLSINFCWHLTSIRVGDEAYIFGQQNSASPSFSKICLKTMKEEQTFTKLPKFKNGVRSVYDGKYIYLHGNSDLNSKGIIKFNPVTHEWSLKHVESYPLQKTDEYWMYPPTMVFVEKLNRIYFFGGLSYIGEERREHDKIWYVEL